MLERTADGLVLPEYVMMGRVALSTRLFGQGTLGRNTLGRVGEMDVWEML